MTQIESLMELSAECHQSVLNNCTGNALTHTSWWVDRTGATREYWHGDHSDGTVGCYCYLEGGGCKPTSVGDAVCRKGDLIFYF